MTRQEPVGAQVEAVLSDARHLLVIAPPGCGKTEVLAMRADRLLRTGAVRPGRRLLALTFTNRARDNLRERLLQQVGPTRMRSSVSVRNFHELSARLVQAHPRTIGLDADLALPHPAWQRRTLASITGDKKSQARAREVLGRLQRSALSDTELLLQLEAANCPIAMRVEQRRREDRYIDYGDLQRYAQLLLRTDRVAALFQHHFDAVIVDEFQDLSRQQYDLSQLICTRASVYVGDPYQGIFGWAGADPQYVHADLARRSAVIELDVSFRSSPAVLSMVNAVTVGLGPAPLRAADPAAWGPSGGFAFTAAYPDDAREADGIVALTDRLATRYPHDTIAVLCRSGFRRGALERAYPRAQHTPQFWDLALDTPRIARLLKAHARGVDAAASLPAQVEDLRSRAVTAVAPTDIETLREIEEACEQLLEQLGSGDSVPAMMARVRDHHTVSRIGPGVHVLNAHTGKGQQFDWVVVMGLEEGHVPSSYSTSPEALLEDQRILLVMLSRARKGLFITRAARTTNQWGRTFTNPPSRWWQPLQDAAMVMPAEVATTMGLTA